MRGEQLSRQWRILNLLQKAGGRRLEDLAGELEVSPRTVRRDLEALQYAGIPIFDEVTEGRGKVWKIEKSWRQLPPISFAFNEVLSLLFAERFLEAFKGAGFDASLKSLIGKVYSVLPDENREQLDRIAESLVASHRKQAAGKETLEYVELLSAAISKRLVVKAKYYSAGRGRMTAREISPCALWTANQSIYLIGWCHSRKNYLTFMLERFHSMELTDRSFEPDLEFDIDAYVGESFSAFRCEPEEVVIEFDAGLKDYLKSRVFHPSQKIIEQGKKCIRVRFMVGLSTPFVSWILGFGELARVISPESLQGLVRGRLKSALSNY